MSGRFVVLGLASARSPWFRTIAQWSHNASIPVEFVKCVSASDARVHLGSARPFSALLVDGALPALDRDLVDDVHAAGCAVIVVDDVRVSRDWSALDVDAVINPVFERRDLVEVLGAHAREIVRADVFPGDATGDDPPTSDATVAAVLGPGGTGSSTVAMALAQGLAARTHGSDVVLCDLARHAELAMLHDISDVSPTIQEVVEAHRAARPPRAEVRKMAFSTGERGYDLLLGLRRSKYWSSLRRRAFDAAFDSITRSWRVVVCDTDRDVEGEADGGSADVEDRNVMARTAVDRADVVVVVAAPGVKGTHSLLGTLVDLVEHGVPPERLLPVVNRAPRSPRARQEITSTIGRLLAHRLGHTAVPSPIYLPERRIDDDIRDGAPLPTALTEPITAAFEAVRARVGPRAVRLEPVPIAVGSLRLPATGFTP